MKKVFSINEKAAPKRWVKFRRWHKAACASDPLTSEERFKELGGIIPEKNVRKTNKPIKEKE